MRRIALFAGLAGLISLVGCKPTYPKCDNDDHCKEQNEVCVQGQCAECATDAQCKEGFSCQGNRCVPAVSSRAPGTCGSDSDCASGRCRNNRCLAEGACESSADCDGGECQAGRCTSGGSCALEPIRFEFNDSSLSSDGQRHLDQVATCIKNDKMKVRLEGHADERGTEEYNLQLSNRRAESVKRYLVTLGVSQGALDAVGYGESRPAVSSSDESAWSANRRVEFQKR